MHSHSNQILKGFMAAHMLRSLDSVFMDGLQPDTSAASPSQSEGLLRVESSFALSVQRLSEDVKTHRCQN